MSHEGLEVFDGDAAACAAAGDGGEVGGVEAEFLHADAEARGDVACAGGVGGDGEAGEGGLDLAGSAFVDGGGLIEFEVEVGGFVGRVSRIG